MDNTFSMTLFVVTCITGIIWFFIKIINFFKKKIYFKQQYNYNNHIKIFHNESFMKSIASFFPILLTIFLIRCFIYEPFYIPSKSMFPTLLPGDCILVKKFSYILNNPFTNKNIIQYNSFQRGDIIVFQYFKNYHINYIKRIIGIPGDKIYYDTINKKLTIYKNYNIKNKKNKKIFINYYIFKKNNHYLFINNKINYNYIYHHIKKIKYKQKEYYIENINFHKHYILILNNNKNQSKQYFYQNNQSLKTWLVPQGKYFVMGDNRDNSLDSRYFGFISEKNIIGKVKYIWISFKIHPTTWPITIKFNRIGKIY